MLPIPAWLYNPLLGGWEWLGAHLGWFQEDAPWSLALVLFTWIGDAFGFWADEQTEDEVPQCAS